MVVGINDGNPIIVTSGTTGQLVSRDARRINFVYWEQPDQSSTSSLVIRKGNASGQIYAHMMVEISGESQTLKYGMWWDAIYIDCVPSGSLYIYTH